FVVALPRGLYVAATVVSARPVTILNLPQSRVLVAARPLLLHRLKDLARFPADRGEHVGEISELREIEVGFELVQQRSQACLLCPLCDDPRPSWKIAEEDAAIEGEHRPSCRRVGLRSGFN